MKVLKWLVIFIIAFLFAWILIFTFMQEPFKVAASAKILAYTTPEIPIYFYVAGAFAIGLLVGLFTAFYYYIVLQKKVHQSIRELKELEEKLVDTRRALEQSESAHAALNDYSYAPEESPSEEIIEQEVKEQKDTSEEKPSDTTNEELP
jgi:hypothetical protein